jgi:hypothetical protein
LRTDPRRLSTLPAVLLGWLLSGCVLFQPSQLEPTAQTAVVRSGYWGKVYRGGDVQILSVSGYEPSLRNTREVAVPAGEQHGLFSVNLCREGGKHCYSLARADIGFRADAGRRYLARAKEKGNGSNQFWVWVEDERSNAVMGGEAPPGWPEE